MAASLPNHAHVGPFTYAISTSKADWKRLAPGQRRDCWGLAHHGSGTILLNPDANPTLLRATLLHELLHACTFAGGVHDGTKRTEEQWVTAAAPRLLDALTRTPGLAEYLAGE